MKLAFYYHITLHEHNNELLLPGYLGVFVDALASEVEELYLLMHQANSPEALKRTKIMEETNDGFKIAEADLKLRGPGDILGIRQHGLPALKIADLVADFEILEVARREVLGRMG